MRNLVFLIGLVLIGCGSGEAQTGWTEANITEETNACRGTVAGLNLTETSKTVACQCYSENLSTSYTYDEYIASKNATDKRQENLKMLMDCVSGNAISL